MPTNNLNKDVTTFMNALNHPFSNEIEALRTIILNANASLTENIKWNAPNYSVNNEDRITMRINPPKQQVQLIFHRGAKVKEQPATPIITDSSGLLTWKENDRAIATFKTITDIEKHTPHLITLINNWINATT
ncbi:MAG: DUF1801 domain-containing protein [Bacteroidia bacterium]